MPRFRAHPAALALAALFFCCSPGGLRAEQLLLKNGDRLTGKVIKREDGKIYFRSDAARRHRRVPANEVTISETPPPPAQSLAGLPAAAGHRARPLHRSRHPAGDGGGRPPSHRSRAAGAVVAARPQERPPPHPPPWSPSCRAAAPGGGPAGRRGPGSPGRSISWKPVITKWTGKVIELGYSNELSTVRTVPDQPAGAGGPERGTRRNRTQGDVSLREQRGSSPRRTRTNSISAGGTISTSTGSLQGAHELQVRTRSG